MGHVNISGQVPGEQQNGLLGIEEEFLGLRTPEPKLAVAVIERSSLKFNDANQETSAVIRIRHIEIADQESEDAAALRGILERQYSVRTGNEYLEIPLDEPAEVSEPELDLDTPLAEKPADEPEPLMSDEVASRRTRKAKV